MPCSNVMQWFEQYQECAKIFFVCFCLHLLKCKYKIKTGLNKIRIVKFDIWCRTEFLETSELRLYTVKYNPSSETYTYLDLDDLLSHECTDDFSFPNSS